MAVVKADGTKVVNLTESGYSDSSAHWAFDGKAVVFASDRAGMRSHGSWGAQDDLYIMFLDGETYDRFRLDKEGRELYDAKKKKLEEDKKKKKDDKADKSDKKEKKDKDNKKEKSDKAKDAEGKAKSDTTEAKKDSADAFKPDFDRCRDRVVRLTWISGSIGDFYLSKDGRKVYYIASYDGSSNLWVRDIDDGSLRVLNKGLGYCALLPSADGKNLYTSGGRIRKVNLDNGSAKDINFRAEFDYKPIKEREYIFDHVVNLINNKFYREDLGGVDWDFYAKSYKRFLPEINNDYDMAEMLSEMLGRTERLAHRSTRRNYRAAPADSQPRCVLR